MRYTLVHGFCFFKLFPIGCIGLTNISHLLTPLEPGWLCPQEQSRGLIKLLLQSHRHPQRWNQLRYTTTCML